LLIHSSPFFASPQAGAAISFGLNAAEIPFNWELGICFVLMAVSLGPMFIVARTVIETNYGKEEGVVPPADVQVEGTVAGPVSDDLEKSEGSVVDKN
jgi:hypothetical protein